MLEERLDIYGRKGDFELRDEKIKAAIIQQKLEINQLIEEFDMEDEEGEMLDKVPCINNLTSLKSDSYRTSHNTTE